MKPPVGPAPNGTPERKGDARAAGLGMAESAPGARAPSRASPERAPVAHAPARPPPRIASEARLREMSTPELIRHAVDEARGLMQAELSQARDDLRQELATARRTAVVLGAAALCSVCALSALAVSVGLSLPVRQAPGVALVGGVLALGAGACAFWGVKKFPRAPLAHTRDRLKDDWKLTRERFA